VGDRPARERRSFRGSGLVNEEVVGVVAFAGERLALCAALGRGVVEGEVTGEDTRRGVPAANDWADNFEAGRPGVLNGEVSLDVVSSRLAVAARADCDRCDGLVAGAAYISSNLERTIL
jgi:hypothetical protein